MEKALSTSLLRGLRKGLSNRVPRLSLLRLGGI